MLKQFFAYLLSSLQLISSTPVLSSSTDVIPEENKIYTFSAAPANNGDIYSIPSTGDGNIEYVEIHSAPDGTATATITLIYIIE